MSNNEKKPETNCVFLPDTHCPVRACMKTYLDTKKQIDKYIKPVGDKETMKIFAPIFNRMEEVLSSEFGFLHNYCNTCPIIASHLIIEP